MRCRKWAVEISKWHEGELSKEQETELLHHLESCRYCQSLEARLRVVSALLNESPELLVSDFLSERITASVAERMRQHSGSRVSALIDFFSYRYRAVVMAGMLIAGLCIGGLVGRDIAGFAKFGTARPSYDLLVLGEIGTQDRSMDYGLIWHDNGEGGRP